tara:strand:- start:6 stop:314 length:309 start_codon:yes stop_codon:yes gene_type:complete
VSVTLFPEAPGLPLRPEPPPPDPPTSALSFSLPPPPPPPCETIGEGKDNVDGLPPNPDTVPLEGPPKPPPPTITGKVPVLDILKDDSKDPPPPVLSPLTEDL